MTHIILNKFARDVLNESSPYENTINIKSSVLTHRNKNVGVAVGENGKVYLYRKGDYDNKGHLNADGKYKDISNVVKPVKYSGVNVKVNAVFYMAAYDYGYEKEQDDPNGLGFTPQDVKAVIKAIDDFARTMNESINEAYDTEKVVGNQYRLTYRKYDTNFRVEELPAKGKKRLTVGMLYLWRVLGQSHPAAILDIIDLAKLDKNDSVQEVMDKILKAAEKVIATRKDIERRDIDIKWSTEEVNPLKVEPEGMEPVTVKAKDFQVKSEWKSFSAFSPSSDFNQSDPYYTEIANTSDVAARKLYRVLRADPNALKNISWDDFANWLNNQGINFRYNHSVWR